MLKLYNTLTKKVETINSNSKSIRFYTCGPTVYNYAHIGNFRSYLFADTIYRSLKFTEQQADWVMNVTDVDDKTIRDTLKEYGPAATTQELKKFTDKYLENFIDELKTINIDPDKIRIIRVSDVIPQIQGFILDLLDKGYAYKTSDGVYFNIEKYQTDFGDYGELVGKSFLEGKKVGARVKNDEYEKENLSDFALWKTHSSEDGNIFWEHPVLGKGRPGWHIECSVINNVAFKGESTDIHTGGVDLVFPHHTNEIAQSQPFYKPFVRTWAHCEHLMVEGQKMAKSAHNFFTLKDLAEKDPDFILAFRYLCFQTDFRKTMNFTWEALEGSCAALHRLYEKTSSVIARSPRQSNPSAITTGLPRSDQGIGARNDNQLLPLVAKFSEAITNDLNAPQALAILWELVGDKEIADDEKLATILKFDQVLGLGLANPPQADAKAIPEEILELIRQRDEARKIRDYKTADELREKIESLGYSTIDKTT